MSYHVPVMVDEVVRGLVTDSGGLYLDVTVGGGGHSKAILQTLQPAGRLVALVGSGQHAFVTDAER